jgi:hypothetical protein
MTTFSRSIVIGAPREWLFDVMQSYDRRLEWDEFLSEARLVDASAAAVGVKAWCVDREGRGMETIYVSFKRPERVAVKMTKGPWMFDSFAGSWAYDSRGAESTEVTFRYGMTLRPRIFGRLGDNALARIFALDMARRLTSARNRLERLYRTAR